MVGRLVKYEEIGTENSNVYYHVHVYEKHMIIEVKRNVYNKHISIF